MDKKIWNAPELKKLDVEETQSGGAVNVDGIGNLSS